MRFQEANWYITIERNFGNQDRLTIQGEIEDIVHEAAGDRDLGILVILNRLTCRRSRGHDQRELFIEVVPVPIMSA